MSEASMRKVQVVILGPTNEQPKLLLLQTNSARGQFWQNVTGSVDPEESYDAAARRELAEETGFTDERIAFLKPLNQRFVFESRWGEEVSEEGYVCMLKEQCPSPTLDPREHQDYKWISIEQVRQDDYGYASNFELFQKACNSL